MVVKTSIKFQKGFTLTELLITIAVLAMLVASVVVVLNPGELLAQARDSRRAGELNNLAQAIGLHASSVIGGYRGTANRVYISLPDSSVNCGTHLASLPTLPAGWEYRCATEANFRRSDGAGWLPHNFNAMRGGSPFHELPIDPVNNTSHYYTYVTGAGWALSSLLESNRHLRTSSLRDGGTDPGRLEVGSNLNLWSRASGLVGYWPLDGSFNDASGNNNHGTGQGFGAVNPFTTGRQGQAGNFDGVDDFVDLGIQPSLTSPNITVEAWVRADRLDDWDGIISNMSAWGTGFSLQIGTIQRIAAMVNGTYLTTTWAPTTGVWYHIVATHVDDTDLNILYVNGAEARRTTRAITYEANARTQIGVFYTRIPPTTPILLFNGLIDEVRIYNRALTATEIRAIFNATR